jgi:hypothetical protein
VEASPVNCNEERFVVVRAGVYGGAVEIAPELDGEYRVATLGLAPEHRRLQLCEIECEALHSVGECDER